MRKSCDQCFLAEEPPEFFEENGLYYVSFQTRSGSICVAMRRHDFIVGAGASYAAARKATSAEIIEFKSC